MYRAMVQSTNRIGGGRIDTRKAEESAGTRREQVAAPLILRQERRTIAEHATMV